MFFHAFPSLLLDLILWPENVYKKNKRFFRNCLLFFYRVSPSLEMKKKTDTLDAKTPCSFFSQYFFFTVAFFRSSLFTWQFIFVVDIVFFHVAFFHEVFFHCSFFFVYSVGLCLLIEQVLGLYCLYLDLVLDWQFCLVVVQL